MRQFLAAALTLLLTACIGTSGTIASHNETVVGTRFWYSIQNDGGMTAEGLSILKSQLDSRLASVRSADMAPGAVQVRITISSYRMRHGAARALVGIMAGTDHINSRVELVDPATGNVLGALTVQSKNQTAMGSAGGLIEGHANEIADFVVGRR